MNAVVLAIGAGLCWGVGELCTRAVLHTGKVGPLTAIAVRSAVALPIIIGAWLVAQRVLKLDSEPTGWTSAGAKPLSLLVLGSGVVAGAAAMILFYSALSLGEISRIKPIAFSIAPASAVVLGWLVLGEPMNARKAVAVALILAGVVLLTAGGKATAHA
ncbi:MAG: EamA family transporter [Phycisphaerales bacterium]